MIGSSLQFDCQTNDPRARVTLLVERTDGFDFVDALSLFNNRIKKTRQEFEVEKLELVDSGDYKCSATNDQDETIELFLGKLVVKKGLGFKKHAAIYP